MRADDPPAAQVRLHPLPLLSIRLPPSSVHQASDPKSLQQIPPLPLVLSRAGRPVRMVSPAPSIQPAEDGSDIQVFGGEVPWSVKGKGKTRWGKWED
ncbi:hypothetical protein EHS25_001603 [Saitozyma podzolica]|uniref:Uncharacterized protein n=1 Tax=Saitozyma podzolica TaxID=1890683 RepID=A0A427YGI5_9TREE|nr:hypothetical protein EHS25_001603 [Saitozyma podzolica]